MFQQLFSVRPLMIVFYKHSFNETMKFFSPFLWLETRRRVSGITSCFISFFTGNNRCCTKMPIKFYLGMRKRALIGWRSQRGGWLSAISRAVIPSDQRSERLSYVASGFSSHAITSGAIQYGVPMNVFLLPIVLSSCADTPKSTDNINGCTNYLSCLISVTLI